MNIQEEPKHEEKTGTTDDEPRDEESDVAVQEVLDDAPDPVLAPRTESAEVRTEPVHVKKDTQQKPPSWTYYALVLTLALIVSDSFVRMTGQEFFYAPRTIYFASFAARGLLFGIVLSFWHRRSFGTNHDSLFIINGWIGFISGMCIAIVHFLQTSTFLNFLDLIAAPVDGALPAVAVSYIVYYLSLKNKPLTKQTV